MTGHPRRAHLDSASEGSTRDELGWAAATALQHARGPGLPGAEPCEIGERLVQGELGSYQADRAALAALKALPGEEELTNFRLQEADGQPYQPLKRKIDRTSDEWRLETELGIEGEAISFRFTWDTKAHVLTLAEVTRGQASSR